jgi:hypothetical protein
MCEKCVKQREELWAEIRDLLNFNRKTKGLLSEELFAELDEVRQRMISDGTEVPDESFNVATECVRAELIAHRCAAITHLLPSGPLSAEPIHVILGSWAHQAMMMESMGPVSLLKLLRRLSQE